MFKANVLLNGRQSMMYDKYLSKPLFDLYSNTVLISSTKIAILKHNNSRIEHILGGVGNK